MDDNLIGYLLDALEPAERVAVELRLRDDADVRARLARLRAFVAPLDVDRGNAETPAGLAERTMSRVAIVGVAPRDTPFGPTRWRRLDVAVAVGVLLMVGGLGSAAVTRARNAEVVAACQNNLRRYHAALNNFAMNHDDKFPQVGDEPPLNRAGAYHCLLRDAGEIACGSNMLCPSRPEAAVYAYCLGFRDPAGHLQGLRRGEPDTLPIMSDREAPAGHGTGHNVLYVGGYVRYSTTPNVGVDGDNIFLNQASRLAAGLHRLDTVLAVGDTAP